METNDKQVKYSGLPMLPPWAELTIDAAVASRMLKASRHLAHLDGLVSMLPDRDLFIEAIVFKEAAASCAIDGLRETSPAVDKYREVLLRESREVLGGKRFTEEDIRAVSSELGAGHLGPDITYLVRFLDNDSGFPKDPIFRMALIQYQFEAMQLRHGREGRVGRLFSMLHLIQGGLLGQPCLCLSAFYLRETDVYSEVLKTVRTSRNWRQWVAHMLDGISGASEYTISFIRRIQALKDKMETVIRENDLQTDRLDIAKLFKIPSINPRELMSGSIKSVNTAKKYLGQLENLGLLSKTKVGKKYVWVNTGLMDILADGS